MTKTEKQISVDQDFEALQYFLGFEDDDEEEEVMNACTYMVLILY